MIRPDIAPYLNPNYWDGHVLGQAEETVQSIGVPVLSSSDGRFAKTAIEANLRSDNLSPLHTFDSGEVFDPTMYQPGTIVLFREEKLRGEPIGSDYSLEELTAQPVPLRASSTSPSFGNRSPIIAATDGSRTYVSHVRWGVVPRQQRNGGEYITSTPASRVVERGIGARAVSAVINAPAPITVGETVHRNQGIYRVNILHLIANGSPERSRKRVFGFMPQLRPTVT
jgi:hypothetical protein